MGKLICAWCKPMRVLDDNYPVNGESHGICKECLARLFAEIDAEDAAAARDLETELCGGRNDGRESEDQDVAAANGVPVFQRAQAHNPGA